MKNKLISTLLIALVSTFLAQPLQAKIWRINNNGFGADYAQINAANNDPNVIAGDTLHLEGSNMEYNGVTLNKKLIIIGAGYFVTENPKTTNSGLSSMVKDITLNAGSAGSVLMGIHVGRLRC